MSELKGSLDDDNGGRELRLINSTEDNSVQLIDLSSDEIEPGENDEIEPGENDGGEPEMEGQQMLVDEIQYSTPDGKSHKLASYSGQVSPPTEGMTFKSWELFENYFRSYAKQQGFGIVRGASAFRQKNGKPTKERRSLTLICEMYGKKDLRVRVNGRKMKLHSVAKQGVKIATRKSKKCECPVHVYASAKVDEDWVIRRVNLEHQGHSPTPCMSRHVSMFRHDAINAVVHKKLLIDLEAGIKLPQIHRSLALDRNGLENTVFTQRDLRNVAAKAKRMKIEKEGGDANAMINYFKKMAANQELFFHAERVDEFDRLTDVMWVDARSRVAYRDFGDVVCFDSTYITNKFHLPFANFVGVNHHGQTLLLGCALLSHENTETFEWLFRNWVECMGGTSPAGFLTDQCAAMRKAAANVMPHSRHRWCIWHIMQKFKDKLGSYTQYEDIKRELTQVIYDSLTVPEFQGDWQSVIQKYKLDKNDWLKGLYAEQHMWVPAHMRHIFWAGMKTMQRSESINSFFDGYVQKQTSLYEFASQYFAAMEARAYAEEETDADCLRNVQELVTGFPIEEEFQKLYTLSKFFEFQTECMKLVYVSLIEKTKVDDYIVENVVGDRVWRRCKVSRKDVATDRTREYKVTLDTRSNEAWCPCMMFESHGIMCRHIIRVFDIHKVKKLPEMFILKRWCKDVEREHTKIKVKHHDMSKSEEVKRNDHILAECEVLCDIGSKSDEYMDIAVECVRAAVAKIKAKMEEAGTSHQADNLQSTPSSVNNKRAIDAADKVSPPSTKKQCNLPPTPGMQGSAGVIPDVVKDPPLPKNPRHRTTDSRYKSASEVATKAKGTSKGRKKKNKDESEGSTVDPSLSATLQKALDLLVQHQTNALYQQQSQQHQTNAHYLQHSQQQTQYPWPNYQQGANPGPPLHCPPTHLPPIPCHNAQPGYSSVPGPATHFLPHPAAPYRCLTNGNTTTHYTPDMSHLLSNNPSAPISNNAIVNGTYIRNSSGYPQGSFGGIGLCENNIPGQNGSSIGYVTRSVSNRKNEQPQRDSLTLDLNDLV